jgi:hypothetical protein
VYGHDIIMFGGFNHNASFSAFVQCTEQYANCNYFNDVWLFQPSNPGGLAPYASTSSWSLLTPASA